MNKTRRNQLQKVIKTINEQMREIEKILHEEEIAYFNIPKKLLETRQSKNIYENINNLEKAISYKKNIINNLKKSFR